MTSEGRSPRSLTRSSSTWNYRDRHSSLVSMRTFYAFGARSNTPSFRSTSLAPSTSILSPFPATPSYPPSSLSYRSSGLFLPRSSSTNFPSLTRIPSPPRLRHRPPRLPLSPPSYIPSSYVPTPRTTPLSTTRSIAHVTPSHYRASPVLSPPPRPVSVAESHASSSSVVRDSSHSVPMLREITTTRDTKEQESPIANIPVATIPEVSQDAEQLEELRRRNKALEDELSKLRLKLKDSDRSNRELKRKLLESEAETKVWKAKSEQAKPKVVEVVRSGGGGESRSLDTALFDQLDSAAEKLSRLNAVNDLKLLQSHMESAIMEISK